MLSQLVGSLFVIGLTKLYMALPCVLDWGSWTSLGLVFVEKYVGFSRDISSPNSIGGEPLKSLSSWIFRTQNKTEQNIWFLNLFSC